MALNNSNNNDCCKCTTPEYEIILNEQGPQGRQGEKGDDGFSPVVNVLENTSSSYRLTIVTKEGQVITPNLKANLPAGGSTGQVLTKNSANPDDCSWQNLPQATQDQEGTARLATENDFEKTETSQVSNNSIVTPELFNSEFKKQSANFVSLDTTQTITGKKTLLNDTVLPYQNSKSKGRIISNTIVNEKVISIIEPYDSYGSFRIGAVEDNFIEEVKNGFDISNDISTYGVTYYEAGKKGKIIANFNLDQYVTAGENIIINKTEEGKLTINSVGGGSGTSDYTQLTNKPQINGHELTGNLEGNTLGLANEQEVEELGNELKEVANTVTNKQDKLTAGDGITINNNVISVNADIPISQNIDVKSINVLQYNNTAKVKIDGTINNTEPWGVFVSGVDLTSGQLTRTKLITASDFDTNNFTYNTETGTISLKNSGGDFIPIEGDVNNIIGTKNLTSGGYIGLTQPLGCGISAGGNTIFTYSSSRVGPTNYFNPIIGSGQSQYTQINSPYLRDSYGTRFVKQTDYATTSIGGTVKVDGTTITINDGVISAAVNKLDLQDVKDKIASTTDVANNVSEALNGFKFVETSEEQYNASDAHDANTLYIITS